MERQILDLLAQIHRAYTAELLRTPQLKRTGLPPFSAQLLSLALRYPKRSQQEFAEMTGRDKAQVARGVRELLERGLLTRVPHETDWRSHLLEVSDEGRAMAKLIERARIDVARQMTEPLNEASTAALAKTLEKMLDGLSADSPRAGPR